MVSSHCFNDRIDPYMYLVSVLCIPVSSIPTSLSFLKIFVLVSIIDTALLCVLVTVTSDSINDSEYIIAFIIYCQTLCVPGGIPGKKSILLRFSKIIGQNVPISYIILHDFLRFCKILFASYNILCW